MTTIHVYRVPYDRGTRINSRRTSYQIRTVGNRNLSQHRQVQIVHYARQNHIARLGVTAASFAGVPFGVPILGVHTLAARSDLRRLAGGDVAVYKQVHKLHSGKTVTRKTFKTKSARTFGKTAFRNKNRPPQLTKAQRQQMARNRRRVHGKFA